MKKKRMVVSDANSKKPFHGNELFLVASDLELVLDGGELDLVDLIKVLLAARADGADLLEEGRLGLLLCGNVRGAVPGHLRVLHVSAGNVAHRPQRVMCKEKKGGKGKKRAGNSVSRSQLFLEGKGERINGGKKVIWEMA